MRRALSVSAALMLLCLAGTFCSLASAASPRRVLVIGGPSDATCSGLIEALRIQLGQAVEVVRVEPSEPGQGGSDDAEAARRLRTADVAIVLWIEETSEQSRVFALTGTAPGAPTELAALSAASPERDRTVALKVGELLENESNESNEPRAPDPALTGRNRMRTRAFVELGARLWLGATPTQLVAGPVLAIGPRWEWPSTVLEGHGVFAFDSGIHASRAAGQVDIDTVFVGLGSRLLWLTGPLAIGPYFDAGIDVMRARGSTPDQHVGARELLLPTAGAGGDVRLRLAPYFELRASGGPRLSLVHERFALEGRRVLDLGWVHASGSLSGVVVFP